MGVSDSVVAVPRQLEVAAVRALLDGQRGEHPVRYCLGRRHQLDKDTLAPGEIGAKTPLIMPTIFRDCRASFPHAQDRLLRAAFAGRITPVYPIAVHENDVAQHLTVVNSPLVMALGEYDLRRAICSSVSQYRSLILGLLTKPK